jgi:NADPH:quinone reductase-like Zn-dependent oxidoreductase
MKALIVDHYGSPLDAHLGEVDTPKPADGQLLVRMHAAAVNPFDYKLIAGMVKDILPISFPHVPGMDGAGDIVALGPGVTGWQQGDAVLGMFDTGALAEYALIKAASKRLARKPDYLDFAHAAAIPQAGLTASTILRAAGISAGQKVLIIGATGGIGLFASQLAKAQGARVIATAKAGDADYIRGLGADEIVDYTSADPVSEVRAQHPEGVDIVIDLINSGDSLFHDSAGLRSGGALVSSLYGPAQNTFANGITVHYIQMRPKAGELEELAERAADGRLTIEVGKSYDFADAARALTDLYDKSKHTRGKSVVRITE